MSESQDGDGQEAGQSVGGIDRRHKSVEIGHCPLCGAYIACKIDHDRDCKRYVGTGSDRGDDS